MFTFGAPLSAFAPQTPFALPFTFVSPFPLQASAVAQPGSVGDFLGSGSVSVPQQTGGGVVGFVGAGFSSLAPGFSFGPWSNQCCLFLS